MTTPKPPIFTIKDRDLLERRIDRWQTFNYITRISVALPVLACVWCLMSGLNDPDAATSPILPSDIRAALLFVLASLLYLAIRQQNKKLDALRDELHTMNASARDAIKRMDDQHHN